MSSTPAVALPPKQRIIGRHLVLVDIENVNDGAIVTRECARRSRRKVEEVITLNAEDHVVVGVSHIGLLNTYAEWPNKRYVVRSGPDGADYALLEIFDENIAARYDEIILVSGDGIFADVVAAVTAAGTAVTVLAHRTHCSKRLRMAATSARFFNTDDHRTIDGAA